MLDVEDVKDDTLAYVKELFDSLERKITDNIINKIELGIDEELINNIREDSRMPIEELSEFNIINDCEIVNSEISSYDEETITFDVESSVNVNLLGFLIDDTKAAEILLKVNVNLSIEAQIYDEYLQASDFEIDSIDFDEIDITPLINADDICVICKKRLGTVPYNSDMICDNCNDLENVDYCSRCGHAFPKGTLTGGLCSKCEDE